MSYSNRKRLFEELADIEDSLVLSYTNETEEKRKLVTLINSYQSVITIMIYN
jgi:hypothetical protein